MNTVADLQLVAKAACVSTLLANIEDSLPIIRNPAGLLSYYRKHAAKLVSGFVAPPDRPASIDFVSWDAACYQAKKQVKAEFVRNGCVLTR